MDKAWAGVDAGKEFHWAHVLDASGTQLLSRKVENDEADLVALIEEVFSFAEDVVWAVDQPGGSAALLLALLWERAQRVLYIPGLTVDRVRDAYRGESKTDARDAYVIADQARMRPDLGKLTPSEVELAELRLLLAFWSVWEISPPSRAPTSSPPTPGWSPPLTTPANALATTKGCEVATRSSNELSTNHRLPVSG